MIRTKKKTEMSESAADTVESTISAAESEMATPAQGLIVKLLIAAILTLFAFIYFDRTSSLNSHTPEENKKLNETPNEKKEAENGGSIGERVASENRKDSAKGESSSSEGRKVLRKRKV